jgi:hypothetical protein
MISNCLANHGCSVNRADSSAIASASSMFGACLASRCRWRSWKCDFKCYGACAFRCITIAQHALSQIAEALVVSASPSLWFATVVESKWLTDVTFA